MSAKDLPYDPAARRDTPLARKLKARVADAGPISVSAYMESCLQDKDFGYYRTQHAIGTDGDFVTAPEISQVFGEILGLWAVVVWQQMGAPDHFNLVELGPGRGTLMRDALRAARLVPAFAAAADVYLIESNATLAGVQRETLACSDLSLNWINGLSALPAGPTIIMGNEFLDTIRASQTIKASDGWRERCVGVDEAGHLQFTDGNLCGTQVFGDPSSKEADCGSILETQVFVELAWELADVAERGLLAALFVDYGHMEQHYGDTLQAVRTHAFEHPLTSPGEADLSVQVDFSSFVKQVVGASHTRRRRSGRREAPPLIIDGPLTQAEFLGQLGIMQRASKLMAANPARATDIQAGVMRLMAPNGMGTRFKAIGVRSHGVPELAGLSAQPARP